MRAILCDIEGTIGSIRFVRDVLFPYAASKLPDFIREHRDDPEVRREVAAAAELAGVDAEDTDQVITHLLRWIRDDVKATPLKALQGMVWVHGYAAGDYQAHVYDDAERCLRRWHSLGHTLHIFSSGSVQAQKLYFRHTGFGDLRPLIIGWFDTTTGPKQEPSAYAAIADRIGVPAGDVLFLSDSPEELDAAAAAGMRTTWIIRPEDSDRDIAGVQSRHALAASFDEITP